MASKDFYQTLGVNKTATKDEIKSAYRKLAKQYHPDVNKEAGAEEKFREVQEAYDTLYDDQKRAFYDRVGHDAYHQNAQQGGNPGGGAGGFGGFGGFGDMGDLGDLFSSFFGGGQRQGNANPTGPRKGNDELYQLKVSFMDAIMGKSVTLNLNVDELCPHCKGSGAQNPSDITTCPQCNGRGHVRQVSNSLFGQVEREVTCPQCRGKGKIITNKCTTCKGSGYVRNKKQKTVNIPAGINNGQQLRLPGMGGRGLNGGPSGDLYIEVSLEKHKQFIREGNDIHIEIPVNFFDAILGTTLKIPTVYDTVDIKIPPGSKDGDILRIKGKGIINKASGGTGDQYIHLKISIPRKLDKKQQSLIEEYRKNSQSESDAEYDKFLKQIQR